MADETNPAPRLRRCDEIRVCDTPDGMILVGPDGQGYALSGDSAALARCVLAFLEQPHTSAEVIEHVETLTGEPVAQPEVVHDLVQLLRRVEAIELHDRDSTRRRERSLRRHRPVRVVLGLTGAVATMSAPAMINALLRRGFHVRVMATANAMRFVTPDAILALTHHRVVASLWPQDEALPVPHIDLAQWADAVVIHPASATTISRLATGDHDCVVSATALATRAPVLVVPSMNPHMYASPSVERNLARLAADGMHVVHPARALEMADAPLERVPSLGGAPSPRTVVPLLEAMLRAHKASGRRIAPRTAEDWDAMYRQHGDAELPWQTASIDDDIARTLDGAPPPPSSVLDVGTGLGTIAVECARRGHRVVATELSVVALERARAAAPEAQVVWLQDDVTASRLHGGFDIVVDRGCLHLLDEAERTRWAAAMARLTAVEGMLVVKTLAGTAADERGAKAYSPVQMQALLGSAFAMEQASASTLPGPSGAAPAMLFVLRRVAAA